jgi:hypothetical protein
MRPIYTALFLALAMSSHTAAWQAQPNVRLTSTTKKSTVEKRYGQNKATESHHDNSEKLPNATPSSVRLQSPAHLEVEQPKSESKGKNGKGDAEGCLYRAYLWATIIGVGGGWVGIFLIIWQARIAKRAADAATKNALALMNAERAWLLLEKIEVPDIRPDSTIKRKATFHYMFKNYGKTPAFITKLVVQFKRYTSLYLLPDDPEAVEPNRIIAIPEGGIAVPPNNSTTEMSEDLAADPVLSEQEILSLHSGTLFLYASAFLRYTDVYGREFTSAFGAWYRIKERMFMRWGPPAYNKHT